MEDLMRAKDILGAVKRNKERIDPAEEDGGVITGYRLAHDQITEIINRCIPTVDAVEVVRCKDCVHGNRVTTEDGEQVEVCCNGFAFECDHVGIAHSPDFFCAEGERK